MRATNKQHRPVVKPPPHSPKHVETLLATMNLAASIGVCLRVPSGLRGGQKKNNNSDKTRNGGRKNWKMSPEKVDDWDSIDREVLDFEDETVRIKGDVSLLPSQTRSHSEPVILNPTSKIEVDGNDNNNNNNVVSPNNNSSFGDAPIVRTSPLPTSIPLLIAYHNRTKERDSRRTDALKKFTVELTSVLIEKYDNLFKATTNSGTVMPFTTEADIEKTLDRLSEKMIIRNKPSSNGSLSNTYQSSSFSSEANENEDWVDRISWKSEGKDNKDKSLFVDSSSTKNRKTKLDRTFVDGGIEIEENDEVTEKSEINSLDNDFSVLTNSNTNRFDTERRNAAREFLHMLLKNELSNAKTLILQRKEKNDDGSTRGFENYRKRRENEEANSVSVLTAENIIRKYVENNSIYKKRSDLITSVEDCLNQLVVKRTPEEEKLWRRNRILLNENRIQRHAWADGTDVLECVVELTSLTLFSPSPSSSSANRSSFSSLLSRLSTDFLSALPQLTHNDKILGTATTQLSHGTLKALAFAAAASTDPVHEIIKKMSILQSLQRGEGESQTNRNTKIVYSPSLEAFVRISKTTSHGTPTEVQILKRRQKGHHDEKGKSIVADLLDNIESEFEITDVVREDVSTGLITCHSRCRTSFVSEPTANHGEHEQSAAIRATSLTTMENSNRNKNNFIMINSAAAILAADLIAHKKLLLKLEDDLDNAFEAYTNSVNQNKNNRKKSLQKHTNASFANLSSSSSSSEVTDVLPSVYALTFAVSAVKKRISFSSDLLVQLMRCRKEEAFCSELMMAKTMESRENECESQHHLTSSLPFSSSSSSSAPSSSSPNSYNFSEVFFRNLSVDQISSTSCGLACQSPTSLLVAVEAAASDGEWEKIISTLIGLSTSTDFAASVSSSSASLHHRAASSQSDTHHHHSSTAGKGLWWPHVLSSPTLLPAASSSRGEREQAHALPPNSQSAKSQQVQIQKGAEVQNQILTSLYIAVAALLKYDAEEKVKVTHRRTQKSFDAKSQSESPSANFSSLTAVLFVEAFAEKLKGEFQAEDKVKKLIFQLKRIRGAANSPQQQSHNNENVADLQRQLDTIQKERHNPRLCDVLLFGSGNSNQTQQRSTARGSSTAINNADVVLRHSHHYSKPFLTAAERTVLVGVVATLKLAVGVGSLINRQRQQRHDHHQGEGCMFNNNNNYEGAVKDGYCEELIDAALKTLRKCAMTSYPATASDSDNGNNNDNNTTNNNGLNQQKQSPQQPPPPLFPTPAALVLFRLMVLSSFRTFTMAYGSNSLWCGGYLRMVETLIENGGDNVQRQYSEEFDEDEEDRTFKYSNGNEARISEEKKIAAFFLSPRGRKKQKTEKYNCEGLVGGLEMYEDVLPSIPQIMQYSTTETNSHDHALPTREAEAFSETVNRLLRVHEESWLNNNSNRTAGQSGCQQQQYKEQKDSSSFPYSIAALRRFTTIPLYEHSHALFPATTILPTAGHNAAANNNNYNNISGLFSFTSHTLALTAASQSQQQQQQQQHEGRSRPSPSSSSSEIAAMVITQTNNEATLVCPISRFYSGEGGGEGRNGSGSGKRGIGIGSSSSIIDGVCMIRTVHREALHIFRRAIKATLVGASVSASEANMHPNIGNIEAPDKTSASSSHSYYSQIGHILDKYFDKVDERLAPLPATTKHPYSSAGAVSINNNNRQQKEHNTIAISSGSSRSSPSNAKKIREDRSHVLNETHYTKKSSR